MTKILELPEELQEKLHRAAQRAQVSDEALALRALHDYIERDDDDHKCRVKEAGDYVQRKNAELYRRLA